VAAMTKGRLAVRMHKLGTDWKEGLRQETLEQLAKLPALDITVTAFLGGQQYSITQLPNISRLELAQHKGKACAPGGGSVLDLPAGMSCSCVWCKRRAQRQASVA
jgi:hypothetical protein